MDQMDDDEEEDYVQNNLGDGPKYQITSKELFQMLNYVDGTSFPNQDCAYYDEEIREGLKRLVQHFNLKEDPASSELNLVKNQALFDFFGKESIKEDEMLPLTLAKCTPLPEEDLEY